MPGRYPHKIRYIKRYVSIKNLYYAYNADFLFDLGCNGK